MLGEVACSLYQNANDIDSHIDSMHRYEDEIKKKIKIRYLADSSVSCCLEAC